MYDIGYPGKVQIQFSRAVGNFVIMYFHYVLNLTSM